MHKWGNVDTQCLNVICSIFLLFFYTSKLFFLNSFFIPPKLTSLLALEKGEIWSKRGRKEGRKGYREGGGIKETVFLALVKSKDSNQIIYSSCLRSRKEGS